MILIDGGARRQVPASWRILVQSDENLELLFGLYLSLTGADAWNAKARLAARAQSAVPGSMRSISEVSPRAVAVSSR